MGDKQDWLEIEWYNGGRKERALIRLKDIRNLQPAHNNMAGATIMGFFRERVDQQPGATVLIVSPTYPQLKALLMDEEASEDGE